MHVADHRLGGDDPLPVHGQPQPQDAVRGRVLRADVEHHLGGAHPTDAGGAEGDVQVAGAHLGHPSPPGGPRRGGRGPRRTVRRARAPSRSRRGRRGR
ncbi:hypothetical protein [Ornithinimicrobium kibberense]|uniref:hypothetical protein n=1 Tax=Ornithinimicrobium kibberense TaxID=282060 RepID=UPI00360FAB38